MDPFSKKEDEMTYQAPELFELGDVEELTFGGTGCWSDHETQEGEEFADQGIFGPSPVTEE
jgi:hypothetical protein